MDPLDDLELLRTFVRIVDCGSISAASCEIMLWPVAPQAKAWFAAVVARMAAAIVKVVFQAVVDFFGPTNSRGRIH